MDAHSIPRSLDRALHELSVVSGIQPHRFKEDALRKTQGATGLEEGADVRHLGDKTSHDELRVMIFMRFVTDAPGGFGPHGERGQAELHNQLD